jgi:site-specific DNA-methyltransferase (adenine-specific)
MRKETIGSAELYCGDCMEYMATLPGKAFELAIVDPPYGIKVAPKGTVGSQPKPGHKRNGVAARNTEFKIVDWDNSIPDKTYFSELGRVSKDQIIWGGNYFPLPPTQGVIVWDKMNDGNDFADFEMAWTSFKKAARFFRFRWNGMLQGDMKNKEIRIHVCQKPAALYKWLLSRYAKPGDRILDTHGGSGSSVIACLDMGFPIVWIEKDADYYESALKRIKDFASQPKLFDEPAQTFTQGDLDLDSRPT